MLTDTLDRKSAFVYQGIILPTGPASHSVAAELSRRYRRVQPRHVASDSFAAKNQAGQTLSISKLLLKRSTV